MKIAEAALFAVAILAVLLISGGLVITAQRRNPKRDSDLKSAQAFANRLDALVDNIYAYTSRRREDPVADFIAGEIDAFRRPED